MPPAYRSITSNTTGASGSFPINKPAGVIDGDLLIVAFATHDNDGAKTHGAPPSGWTLLSTLYSAATAIRASVFWKIAASEPASWTFTKTADGFLGVISCVAVSGPGSPAAPLAAWNGALDTGGDALAQSPSITATSASDLLVYIAASRQSGLTFTAPAGYTEQLDLHLGTNDVHLTIDTNTAAGAGATGVISATGPGTITNPSAVYLLAVASTAPPNPSGTMTRIKFGNRLAVTDEGGGVIRVDFV